jgi:micrococcal nuclease
VIRVGGFILVFLFGMGAGYILGLASPRPATTAPAPAALDLNVTDGGIYRVRKVVDGDTVMLENGVHVRYHGINTPEMGHFVKDQAPLALEATSRNISLVEGKRIRLKLAPEPLDMHGRVVATVLVLSETEAGETDAGRILLKEGLARPMGLGVPAQELQELKQLEAKAKEAKLGIWGLEDELRGPDKSGKPYCATSTGNVYHIAACTSAKKIRAQNLHQYATIEEAEAAGLKPCSKCLPK